jgi:hypothetical protein
VNGLTDEQRQFNSKRKKKEITEREMICENQGAAGRWGNGDAKDPERSEQAKG